MISFTVTGAPVGKARARVSTRSGFTRAYTPKKSADYEKLVACEASKAMQGVDVLDGAVGIELIVYMPIPKSWSKAKRQQALSDKIYPASKPDLDNIVKSVCDAINGIVFKDDSQVVELTAKKFYDEQPRIEVRVWKI